MCCEFQCSWLSYSISTWWKDFSIQTLPLSFPIIFHHVSRFYRSNVDEFSVYRLYYYYYYYYYHYHHYHQSSLNSLQEKEWSISCHALNGHFLSFKYSLPNTGKWHLLDRMASPAPFWLYTVHWKDSDSFPVTQLH